ncbi:uncharacterized protein LOC131884654 [Tigriopus californicus]|uniref:uncharacterized protein LOC131884654 n=1 Tax=Tigriopus californicus TaxID=6832 RepID=UPI0027DA920B|nr:uncharacterized protein LOC131884654 [Tigriopus californicus]
MRFMALPHEAHVWIAFAIISWCVANKPPVEEQGQPPKLMVVAAVNDQPVSEENIPEELDSSRISKRIGYVSERDTNQLSEREVAQARKTNRVGPNNPTDLVSDIHCLESPTSNLFTAFLRPPDGQKETSPVLEEKPTADEDLCLITATNLNSVFALDLNRLEECGVKTCSVDGERWLCLLVRFPIMSGLKLPEDEVIEIKCKPQEPSVEGRNVINFQKNAVEQRSPTIYLGGGHDFLSEIGLFRRLAGTDLFASRVQSGSTIELGENVQLRSIVRAGDGWNYAKITDVIIHRVHKGQPMRDERNTARLVTEEGCRNPSYRVLAPVNPWRDTENRLINNFDFRVFMFQDMESGDAIMISAKVVACVEEIDCAPAKCGRDADAGYGKRRRRSVSGNNSTDSARSASLLDIDEDAKTKRWEENLELKIRLPHDLIHGGGNPAYPESQSGILGVASASAVIPLTESECKLYLILTLSVALTFCVLSAGIVLIACIKRVQQVRSRDRYESKLAHEHQKGEGGGDPEHILTPGSGSSGDSESMKLAYMPYIISYDVRHSMQHTTSQTALQNGSHSVHATPRPVTVRSVKRRDKAKAENRLHMSQS